MELDKATIVTVSPKCPRDTKKHVKRKPRFTLFNAALLMLRSNPNEKTKQKKVSDKTNIIIDIETTNYDNNNLDKQSEGWKTLVGSIRPLHLPANQSPSASPQRSSSIDSTPDSPSSLSTTSCSTMSKYASASNLQELANAMSSSSVSSDNNLQEVGTTMSHSASETNLCDLVTASTRKHSASMGNIYGLAKKGHMSYSKSTSNLQDFNSGAMSRYASALNLLDLDLNEEVDAEEDGEDNELENGAAGDVMIDSKADQFIAQFYQQMNNQRKGKLGH